MGILLTSVDNIACQKAIDIWHHETKRVFGSQFQIQLFDKNEGVFDGFTDKVLNGSFARMQIYYSNDVVPNICEPYLAITLAEYPQIDVNDFTHEVAHMILGLRGYQVVRHPIEKKIATIISSLSQHAAVYDLQQHLFGVDSDVLYTTSKFREKLCRINLSANAVCPQDKVSEMEVSLVIADSLYSPFSKYAKTLTLLKERQPRIYLIVSDALDVLQNNDMLTIEGSRSFCSDILRQLKLGPNWTFGNTFDETRRIMSEVKELPAPSAK